MHTKKINFFDLEKGGLHKRFKDLPIESKYYFYEINEIIWLIKKKKIKI